MFVSGYVHVTVPQKGYLKSIKQQHVWPKVVCLAIPISI